MTDGPAKAKRAAQLMEYFVYILECSDGSYYTGMTSDIAQRLDAHNEGVVRKSYTFSRRPVKLVWAESFHSHDDAFHAERQIKGWNRKKKQALMNNNWAEIHEIVKTERKERKKQEVNQDKESL